ncbi:MAG: PQQ-dependent sugar dehydrogenase [Solirubrobacteraceae bacterium]
MRFIPLLCVLLAGCGSSERAESQVKPADASSAQPAATGVRLRSIGRFSAPIYVAAAPGDTHRLFVVQRGGSVVVLRDGRRSGTFLRVATTTDGERGLLSIAFAPDYAQSGLVYSYSTAPNGDIRIDEFHAAPDADRVDAGSRRLVLSIPHPESNHNGGQLQFGPDGLLYAGVGDGGSEGDPNRYGQNLGVLYGKLLRIDPRASGGRPYTVPDSNPFVGRSGVRPEIYAYGLRNPWRFSFDRSTGAITIGDVGQGAIEEIDHEPRDGAAGVNFGWSAFEGRSRYNGGSAPDAVPPVIQHTHADGWCSIVGGYVMRDASVPALLGRYVYGDLCQPRLYAARLRSHSASDRRLGLTVPELVSFGEDAAGNVYAVSLSGPVYRIDAG